MDEFEQHLMAEEQHRLMTTQNPHQDAASMLQRGFVPMITADLKVVWGQMENGKMVSYKVSTKNAQGIEMSTTVPVEAIFVGPTSNAQLTGMGNVRHEGSLDLIPSQMHHMEGSNSFITATLENYNPDPEVDLDMNEAAVNFSKSKGKQGITLVAAPHGDNFGGRTVLQKLLGKRGLVNEAMAYFASQPENRGILTQRFPEIARSYTADQAASIHRAVFDDLTGKSNGYHFGYEARGGSVTLPVYGNLMFESVKKDRDGKRIKPDNSKFLTANYDNTGGLAVILKKMYPRATYRYLKKTDHTGMEIGFQPGDQLRLQNLHNPTVALTLGVRVYFNGYNSFTLDVEPDHSGIKILYDGDAFTSAEIATFDEWKRTGEAPPRHQVNMAMTTNLSSIAELAKSDAMKLKREAFYRDRNGSSTAVLAIESSETDADLQAVLDDVDEESQHSQDKQDDDEEAPRYKRTRSRRFEDLV